MGDATEHNSAKSTLWRISGCLPFVLSIVIFAVVGPVSKALVRGLFAGWLVCGFGYGIADIICPKGMIRISRAARGDVDDPVRRAAIGLDRFVKMPTDLSSTQATARVRQLGALLLVMTAVFGGAAFDGLVAAKLI
jgi:hypothetical protein